MSPFFNFNFSLDWILLWSYDSRIHMYNGVMITYCRFVFLDQERAMCKEKIEHWALSSSEVNDFGKAQIVDHFQSRLLLLRVYWCHWKDLLANRCPASWSCLWATMLPNRWDQATKQWVSTLCPWYYLVVSIQSRWQGCRVYAFWSCFWLMVLL